MLTPTQSAPRTVCAHEDPTYRHAHLLPPPHSLTPLAATDLFCFYNFVIVTFYNWDQMVPNHLGLTVYTQCNALAIHPGCHVCQQFYGEVVFIPRCGGVTAGLPTPLLKGVWVVSSLGPLWRSV